MRWHTLHTLKSFPRSVSFYLGTTYNTLALPQNRARWEFEVDIDCALFGKEEASVDHILAGYQKALQSGRYTLRHNSLLVVIAHEM